MNDTDMKWWQIVAAWLSMAALLVAGELYRRGHWPAILEAVLDMIDGVL